MSRALLFKGKLFRHSVNIHYCFSLQRKRRLSFVLGRPWANGLNRLLAARRGLKKGVLAELASVRPALISAVANSAQPPQISTLERIAAGFTKYDRLTAHDSPDVELWEFFVTDEQATLLRERAIKTRDESGDAALVKRIAEAVTVSLKAAREERATPAPPVIVPTQKKRRA